MRTAEVAHAFDVAMCMNPQCRSLHIRLFDCSGEMFATAAIKTENIPQIAKRLQDVAYQIAAMNDDKG